MVKVTYTLLENGRWNVYTFEVATPELAKLWVDTMKSVFGDKFCGSY